jgi:hypothetical protein
MTATFDTPKSKILAGVRRRNPSRRIGLEAVSQQQVKLDAGALLRQSEMTNMT